MKFHSYGKQILNFLAVLKFAKTQNKPKRPKTK